MNRKRLEELVSGYLDGELTTAELRELESELERSTSARQLVLDYKSQSEMLTKLADVETRGPSSTGHNPDKRASRRSRFRLLLVAAAAILVLLGVLLVRCSRRAYDKDRRG